MPTKQLGGKKIEKMYAAPVVASVIKAELQLTSFVGLISHGLDQIPWDAADSTYISQEMVVKIC